MDYKALLEGRHEIYLQWVEPWPASGPQGNDIEAHLTLRATVHGCINMRRLTVRESGHSPMANDERFLAEFIDVHWATLDCDLNEIKIVRNEADRSLKESNQLLFKAEILSRRSDRIMFLSLIVVALSGVIMMFANNACP